MCGPRRQFRVLSLGFRVEEFFEPMQRITIVEETGMARSKLTSVVMRVIAIIWLVTPAFAAELGGKPEKPDVIVTYAQPSGAFTPIWVAYEAGLFKKYGLNATLQLLTPQVSAQAVVSDTDEFFTHGTQLN